MPSLFWNVNIHAILVLKAGIWGVGILGILGGILGILKGVFPKVLSEEVLEYSALSSACPMSRFLLEVEVRVPDGKILDENVLRIVGDVLSERIPDKRFLGRVLVEGIFDEYSLGVLKRILVGELLDKYSLGVLKRILVGRLLASSLRKILGRVCVPDEEVLVEKDLGEDVL